MTLLLKKKKNRISNGYQILIKKTTKIIITFITKIQVTNNWWIGLPVCYFEQECLSEKKLGKDNSSLN